MPEGEDKSKKPIQPKRLRDEPAFADLVLEFVNGLAARVRLMEEALAVHDLESLRRAAQQLKASGGGYGYPAITTQAAELERSAKERTIAECGRALEQLKQLCQRVVVQDS